MKRRGLLALALAAVPMLTAVGFGVSSIRPGLVNGKLTSAGGDVFRAVARAVLDGSLPTDATAARIVLDAHLHRLGQTISGLSEPSRAELSQLLSLLAHPAGRVAFASLSVTWNDAPTADVGRALEGLRRSAFPMRQQAYHALRDLTNAAFYADAQAWTLMAYPGPRAV